MKETNWKFVIHSFGVTECQWDWTWDTGKYPYPDYDLWIVLKGNGSLYTEGREYDVSEGACMLLRPGERYVGHQNPENRLVVFHLHFDALDERQIPVSLKDYFPLFREIYDFLFVRRLLFKMLDSCNKGQEEEAVHWLQVVLDEIRNQDRQNLTSSLLPIREQIQTLCECIQRTPGGSYRLKDLAEEYGYSPDYFGRLFSQIAGIPLSDYVIRVRINQARIYLRDSNDSVASIAGQLGYGDVGFFCRQFKKQMGCSPGQYRHWNCRMEAGQNPL